MRCLSNILLSQISKCLRIFEMVGNKTTHNGTQKERERERERERETGVGKQPLRS